MFLTHLSLTNFRAFTRLDMDVPRRILMLVGDNAQGKTSLLEAVFFLATFTSFHAQNDRQLINFLALHEQPAVTRLVADYECDGRKHKLEVRLILDSNGKRGQTTAQRNSGRQCEAHSAEGDWGIQCGHLSAADDAHSGRWAGSAAAIPKYGPDAGSAWIC